LSKSLRLTKLDESWCRYSQIFILNFGLMASVWAEVKAGLGLPLGSSLAFQKCGSAKQFLLLNPAKPAQG